MKISAKDFATMFAYQWYQDFPLDGWYHDFGGRADWTYHCAGTFKKTVGTFGLFPMFERAGKVDGVAFDADKKARILAEWEWLSPADHEVNEVKKLSEAASFQPLDLCFFLTYSPEEKIEKVLEFIATGWQSKKSLVVMIITYTSVSTRAFKNMEFYEVTQENKSIRPLRTMPALPWGVKKSKWSIVYD